MENEVVYEAPEEETEDVSAANLEALLKQGDALNDEEKSTDETEEETVLESEEEGETEETTEETEEEEKDEYYSDEEVLELTQDLDSTKFDRSKVKPGSLADKTLKNLERGYNKKYEELSHKKKETVRQNAELVELQNKVSQLQNKNTASDDYFEKQRKIDQEKVLEEELALLDPEERESRKMQMQTQNEITQLKNQLANATNTISQIQLDKRNVEIDNQISDAISRNELSKEHLDRVRYAIGNQWELDKKSNRYLTPIDEIVDRASTEIKASEKKYYADDSLDKFFKTKEGEAVLKKQMKVKLDRLKKLKKTPKNVSSSSGRKVTSKNDEDEFDFSKADSTNIERMLGGAEI